MKVLVYFLGVFGGLIIPVGGFIAVAIFGPSAYIPVPGVDPAPYVGSQRFDDGSRVIVAETVSPSEARSLARRTAERIETRRLESIAGVHRYQRVTGGYGLVGAIDRYAVQVDAADRETVEMRMNELGFVTANPRRNPVAVAVGEHLRLTVSLAILYLLLYALWMSRGAAWAARIDSDRAVAPIDADTMRGRLLALNGVDAPFSVSEAQKGRLRVHWRYADAKWQGLLEQGAVRRVYTIELQLDSRSRRVRAIHTAQGTHTSASLLGRAWFRFYWHRSIPFLDRRHGREVGLLLDDEGNWRVQDAYRYRFSVEEMRQPLVEAVTRGGWSWSPVLTFFRPVGG
ncbi:hypothetical protein [Desulfobulbus alkaliphilus]|uniref:hypothetical protein n=1 Tax=Desulfobulbus alkaliphilus TaxID=869814 RepID=UPI00196318F9|nr:hypothetical protein [Desulfobulbus alkaliphilus]MBM9537541.1 hypothetical protein [Desulfobulbus alkaliphilus]